MTSGLPCPAEPLVPHRGRMRLVRTLTAATGRGARTEAVIDDSWPTYAEGTIDPLVLIELIAQSFAAHSGWLRRGLPPPADPGWVVGIRRAEFAPERLATGTVLHTDVEQLRKLGAFVVFRGEVCAGERTVCRAELQAFREDDAPADAAAREGTP